MANIADILKDFHDALAAKQAVVSALPYASPHALDNDLASNLLAEGALLKAFTDFENYLEASFLHFVVGGVSTNGYSPIVRLANCNVDEARAIVKGGQTYIDWSRPKTVRDRSDLFFKDGEPIRSGVDPKSMSLAEIEKIRNMIAHDSVEASAAFADVQLAVLKAAPLFKMSPGQLLRLRRSKGPKVHWCAHYLSEMGDAANAIAKKVP